jgi:phosphatidylserine decarboxylase
MTGPAQFLYSQKMLWALKWLPRKLMSRFIGWVVHFKAPFVHMIGVRIFAWYYNINVEEAEKSLDEYHTIGDLFTRRLKHGLRPISHAWAVHPCDSEIIQHGHIKDGTLIQAKGLNYELKKLTEDEHALDKYGEGYFVTYYLCPTDYHRVHSPVHGFVKHVMYRSGDLWPVNMPAINNVQNLYVVNERLVVEMATEYGPVGVVMVGATNVGSMSLAFDPKIRTNRGEQSIVHDYKPPVEIVKGEELGIFHMGSTVIVLYSEEFRKKFESHLSVARRVKIGENLIKP